MAGPYRVQAGMGVIKQHNVQAKAAAKAAGCGGAHAVVAGASTEADAA